MDYSHYLKCFCFLICLQWTNLFGFHSDNLNGAQVLGRIIRVDHVTKYKKKEEEDEETAQQKREARGVCHAFQRGECNRGAGCKFSHDEQVRFIHPWERHLLIYLCFWMAAPLVVCVLLHAIIVMEASICILIFSPFQPYSLSPFEINWMIMHFARYSPYIRE